MRLARIALLPAALLSIALAAPALAETKIGVINMSVLMRDAPQVRAADSQFKIEFDKREKDLQAERKKFQEDFKKAQREADAMSPQQKAAAEKDLFNRKSDLDLKERQFSEQVQARNQELQRAIFEKFNKAIDQVAREKGLDLVLRDAAFVNPSLDLTAEVIKKLAAMPEPAAEPKKKK